MRKITVLAIAAMLLVPVVLALPSQSRTNGRPLDRMVFIHYRKGFGKPPGTPGNGPGNGNGETTCYGFLAKFVKWKEMPVSYVIDPDNPDGLTEDFITNAIYLGAEEWDAHTGAELFNDAYTIDYSASWDSDSPDGKNELVFGNYPEEGVIGVTVVWGYFSGPLSGRKIVEFDILFDTDFSWGDATLDATVMDLQNIATHELGHGVGMGDLYDTVCSLETMYGYSSYGETVKRDLHTGDIVGIQELYGA